VRPDIVPTEYARTADEPSFGRERRLVVVLLLVNAVLRAWLAAALPLLNEEAYYWEWSCFPAPGYLDHPPMVAWLIRAASALAPGGGPWAVRLPALLLGTGSQWLVFRLALAVFGDRRTAWRALLTYLALPMSSAFGVLMVTESPQIFAALLALLFFARAARHARLRDWLAGGAALGLALLSNFIAALLLPALIGLGTGGPPSDRRARRRGIFAALLTAAAIASPFLWWNVRRGFPTFALQLAHRHLQEIGRGPKLPVEWLFEQLVNAGPLLFLPLSRSLLVRPADGIGDARGRSLLRRVSGAVLLVFMAVGVVAQTHPNWTALAFPPAAVLLAGAWTRSDTPRVARRRRGLALAAARLLGWPATAAAIEERRAREPWTGGGPPLLFAGDYRFAGAVSYQRRALPDAERFVINLGPYARARRQVGDAQIHYLPLAPLAGRGGLLLVRPGESRAAHLCALFDRAEEIEPLRQPCGGRVLQEYRVFRVGGLRPRPPYRPPEIEN